MNDAEHQTPAEKTEIPPRFIMITTIILSLYELKLPLRQTFIYQQSYIIITSQVYIILKENLEDFWMR